MVKPASGSPKSSAMARRSSHEMAIVRSATARTKNRVRVLGCPIDNLTLAETLHCVEEFVRDGTPRQHVVVNVDKLVKFTKDPALREIIESCDLINVDGQPVVWAARLLGINLKERVAGIDLMEALIDLANTNDWTVYFLGAKAAVVEKLVSRYQRDLPTLRVVGWRDGYWTNSEESSVVETVREKHPDLLFVGISSPKKEQFVNKYLQRLNIPFVMGVGGSFDVFAGVTRRAPGWMRRFGLEWFWRFLQEPRRMWKRYFVDDLSFVVLLARHLIRRYFRHEHRSRDS